MRYEGLPTFNVYALVVLFLGFTGNLKATACMRWLVAHRTIYHFVQLSRLTSSQ